MGTIRYEIIIRIIRGAETIGYRFIDNKTNRILNLNNNKSLELVSSGECNNAVVRFRHGEPYIIGKGVNITEEIDTLDYVTKKITKASTSTNPAAKEVITETRLARAANGVPYKKAYVVNGKPHRLDGPAVVTIDPDTRKTMKTEWYRNGVPHRKGGPAISTYRPNLTYPITNMWYEEGLLHNDLGPAIEHRNDRGEMDIDNMEFFRKGKRVSEYPWFTESQGTKQYTKLIESPRVLTCSNGHRDVYDLNKHIKEDIKCITCGESMGTSGHNTTLIDLDNRGDVPNLDTGYGYRIKPVSISEIDNQDIVELLNQKGEAQAYQLVVGKQGSDLLRTYADLPGIVRDLIRYMEPLSWINGIDWGIVAGSPNAKSIYYLAYKLK